MEDVAKFLDDQPEVLTYYIKKEVEQIKHKLETKILTAADGDTTLLCYDEELIKQLNQIDIFGDGTYATRPNIEMKRSSQYYHYDQN